MPSHQSLLRPIVRVIPSPCLAATTMPDATPAIVVRLARDARQTLLAQIRYNHLLDLFTGFTCYALPSRLHATPHASGRPPEADEIYVGVNRQGEHYVFPVRVHVGKARIATDGVERDYALCAERFPGAYAIPIAAQRIDEYTLALFAFTQMTEGIRVSSEQHYRLAPQGALSPVELDYFRQRSS